MSFGERLQAVRRENGMTQEAFAAQLKVSRQAVSKWESCRGYPEIEKIIYICNRYGVTMDALFADEVPRREAAPPEAEELRGRTLKASFGDFWGNLSLKNKLVGLGCPVALGLLGFLCARGAGGGADNMMAMVWIGAVIVFGIAEAVTAGLVSIWFVAGSVAAMIAAVLGLDIWAQLGVFLAGSAAALAVTRPLVKKFSADRAVPTNADRALGHVGKVTETIDNGNSAGAVYVDGKTWTARSADGSVIPAGERVRVETMEGVKLFVRTCEEKAEVL